MYVGTTGVYRGQYREVKCRLFVSYDSYLVLLKYMTCIDIISAVSGMGQPLVGCRNERDVTAVREV